MIDFHGNEWHPEDESYESEEEESYYETESEVINSRIIGIKHKDDEIPEKTPKAEESKSPMTSKAAQINTQKVAKIEETKTPVAAKAEGESEYESEEEEESYYETESSHLSNNFITGIQKREPQIQSMSKLLQLLITLYFRRRDQKAKRGRN